MTTALRRPASCNVCDSSIKGLGGKEELSTYDLVDMPGFDLREEANGQ